MPVLYKNKPTLLLTLCVVFLIATLAFFGTFTSKRPHAFELTYAETSYDPTKYFGAVIPASCNSSPPTDHHLGDCPLEINTNLSDTIKIIDLNFVQGSTMEPARIQWSSNAATFCLVSWTAEKQGSAGEVYLDAGSYKMACSDGVYYSNVVNFTVDPDPCANGACTS